jgi:hypothetical protein
MSFIHDIREVKPINGFYLNVSVNYDMTWKAAIPVIFVLGGCSGSEQTKSPESTPLELTLRDTFNLPLDTTKIISLLDIKLQDQIADFDTKNVKFDTIELVSPNFACDCQNWVTDEYWENQNLGKFGYFIEPFNDDIQLYEGIAVYRNRIRLIGTERFENDLPLNTKLSDTIRVFTYYSYEILLPAKVYGPKHHTGKTELPSSTEELIETSVITIKN